MNTPSEVTPKYPILDDLSVSHTVLEVWQKTTDIIADLVNVPAALIMRVHPDEIEVLVRSDSVGNVYRAGERAPLNTGLYCETVMDTLRELSVPDALKDPQWNHNPDIKLGMISYYGLPLTWPSGEIFGTFCILDIKENHFYPKYRELMFRFRDSIKLSLGTIYENHLNTTEARQAKEQIRTLSQAVEQSPVSVVITDADANIEYVNRTFERITGYEAKEVLGQNPKMFQSGKTPPSVYKDLWETIISGDLWKGELQNRKKSGELYWEHAHIAPVLDPAGNICHFLAVKEDVTSQKRQAERILHQALYDPLTNLPNRGLVNDRLEQLLIEAQRSNHLVAVLFLDMDDFKKVNDSLGHEEGDKILVQAARRLTGAVRDGDTVGRLGGDEFVVLLGGINSASDARPVAESLLDRFRGTFQLNGRDLVLTASLGIAVFPGDGENAAELLRNADTAMYHAKEQGRNTYYYFTKSMNREVSRRLMIEEQLFGALARGEFHLCYQPIMAIQNRAFVGAEALLRWSNQAIGEISSDEFIPIAEQTGMIVQIGRYVITEALGWAAQWRENQEKNFKIAINLSPRQFRDPDLVPFIEDALQQAGVPGECLELEITEGVLMSGHSYIDQALTAIGNLGIGIVMDDFGTGYSSLNYLRNYPFDVVKIDRSFIHDITLNDADRVLVNAAISMAHGLGLKVVAEGVETEDQFVQLSEQGCDFAQGYLLSKPISADEMMKLLEKQKN
ncbi:MAG: EAL domain-containing protein [Candidatus Thiodiazotropha sp. (ex Dulcina madagascariensis)]|nr:EAL domain-containing protein [Candidatus Thiodiazotropha sp. (ex Dulcina madagascariensis)]